MKLSKETEVEIRQVYQTYWDAYLRGDFETFASFLDDDIIIYGTAVGEIFYTKEEAEKLEKQGYTMMEDAGRGYRRVVASPKPIDIVQKKTIKTLIDNSEVVITVGGGGIPVKYVEGKGTLGEFAVIDKDFASAKLAEIIDADYLIILTAVEKVAINYGKDNEEWLSKLTVEKAKQYIKEGHFAPGSMLPKVEAAMGFAMSKPGRNALITSLEKANDGIAGLTGTVIVAE